MHIEPDPKIAAELADADKRLNSATPQEVLRWAIERFGTEVTLACSFGGPTGMALLDMAAKIDPDIDVFYVDTHFLFPETYALVGEASAAYGVAPRRLTSRWTPERQAAEFGAELWAHDPDLCCQLRKVEPTERALEGKAAWISGLRRSQSKGRAATNIVEWDAKFGLVKVNPLATWDDAQVWAYIHANRVPFNILHEQGYPSIGCTHCTRAVAPGEDPRAGRWSGQGKTECGLHTDTLGNREQGIPQTPRS